MKLAMLLFSLVLSLGAFAQTATSAPAAAPSEPVNIPSKENPLREMKHEKKKKAHHVKAAHHTKAKKHKKVK